MRPSGPISRRSITANAPASEAGRCRFESYRLDHTYHPMDYTGADKLLVQLRDSYRDVIARALKEWVDATQEKEIPPNQR